MKLIPVIVKIEGHSEYIVGYQCVRDSWLLPESNEMLRMALERALPKDRTTKNKFNIHLVQYNGFEFVRTYLSVIVGVESTSRIRYSNDAQLADLLLGKQPYQDQLFYELTKVRGLMTPDSSAIGLTMLARQGHVDAINELKHVYHRKEIQGKTLEMIIPTLRDVANAGNAGSKEAALALAEILRRSHHKELAQEYYTKAKQLKPTIQAKYQKYTVFLPAISSAQTLQSKSASQEYKEQKILADPIKQLLLGFECKQNFEKLKNSKGRSHYSKQLQRQAFTHFSEAANAHDIEAQYQLSLCYRQVLVSGLM